tara:strand:+ start:123 stop:317 length:195 start_codon:yes stop_codon:yes gene_type:complete
MLTIPLIRTDTGDSLTTIERTTQTCEQIITALMMQGSLNQDGNTVEESDMFRTLSVATIIPAEA